MNALPEAKAREACSVDGGGRISNFVQCPFVLSFQAMKIRVYFLASIGGRIKCSQGRSDAMRPTTKTAEASVYRIYKKWRGVRARSWIGLIFLGPLTADVSAA